MEKDKDPSSENISQPEDVFLDTMDENSASKQKLNASTDPSNIKFTTVNLENKNGEAKVDIHVVQTSIGMGKEELMKYANEPFWVRMRMFLFVLFWITWITMLVGAVIIILLAPRCPPAPKLQWYQKTAMYQVSVESFKDDDGDGVGDIRGLMSKLNYFEKINVKTLLLNALYAMSPTTNGIVNHTEIDRRYGTMSDFELLVAEMKKKDMKLVLDFIPNQSSDEHRWFIDSENEVEPYTDFYIWRDGTNGELPNNWVSKNGESSWQWSDKRHQYYLHTFDKHQPDLNLRNEHVRHKLEEVMRFWLDKDIDGFKVKSASHLIPDQMWRDEPLNTPKAISKPKYEDISHVHTLDQTENLDVFAEWREVLGNYSDQSSSPKILMAELSGPVNSTARYYGNDTFTLVDFPLNLELTKLNEHSLALDLKEHLDTWKNSTPSYAWPNWVLGNEYSKRLVDRVGNELIDGLFMVATLARGTPITYYGDEIGMSGPPSADRLRIEPMIWNNETYGGFTNDTRFTVQARSSVNVEAALNDKSSHLKIFQHLNKLREQPAISFGKEEYPVLTENIFTLMRVRKGSPGYLVVFNMGVNATVVDFSHQSSHLPENGKIEVRSRNIQSGPLADGQPPKIKLSEVALDGKQAVVLSFVPKFED